jgi:hypothetical protein
MIKKKKRRKKRSEKFSGSIYLNSGLEKGRRPVVKNGGRARSRASP